MKLNLNFKKFGIIIGSIMGIIYALFLVLPFIVSPFVNKYAPEVQNIVKESAGLNLKLENIGVITTPTLGIGVKAEKIELSLPQKDENLLLAKNLKIDLKLLPLIVKRIQLGNISADNIQSVIGLKNNGDFEVFDYFTQTDEQDAQSFSLPYGLKLSNHLPNIKVKNYKITLLNSENKKEYYLEGENFKITDFTLNKRIKFSTIGKIVFDNHNVSNFDVKIDNKIMPDLLLDDLIFPKEVQIEEQNSEQANNLFNINILGIFDSVVKNKLCADLNADIKISGTYKYPIQNGLFELNNLTIAQGAKNLPSSYFKFLFKGNNTDIDSVFYTSFDKAEHTRINGNIRSGQKPYINLSFKSNAQFNNLIRLIDSIAQSFGVNDLKTLSATGGIDADFNINSDLKTITSSGYLKVAPSSLKYGLYNTNIDNIIADINLDNNNLNIKNTGFSVGGHSLNLYGTITQDAVADLKLITEKMPLKGLLLTCGQLALLNENNIYGGSISLETILKGKITEINPDINLNVSNVDIYNKPAKTKLTLKDALIKILFNKYEFSGDIVLNSLKLNLDGSVVVVPTAKILADKKDINIKDTYVMLNNSKIDIKGIIKDYLTDSLNIDITASGNLISADVASFIPPDVRSMFPYKGSMPVKIVATGDSKTQNISFDLSATPQGFIKILDIDKLRNKTTKIHSDIKINGDNIVLDNSGIYAQNNQIVKFSGGINNLSDPRLNINILVPSNVSFTIPGMGNNSNITGSGNVTVNGSLLNPKLKGKVTLDDISIKDMNFVLSNTVANFNGEGIKGHATASKMKFDGIVATNISSEFSLINFTDFYLKDISADAFSGKVSGNLSYNIPKFAFSLDFIGKSLNSTDAVYGAIGIPKALTGTLGFKTKLTGKGVTDTEIIKSLKGDVDFDIKDGRFVSIGKLENLVNAQNIVSNSILKSALSALTTANSLQETDKFKLITGKLLLSGGSADIINIFVSGPLMSYYIKGKYNIIPNSANMNILGRLDSKIISYLGPLGQLSAQKLLSYIPKFGAATAQILDKLTQDPKNENVSLIPELTTGSTNYKDFKVIFNGPADKSSSVRSFKWLSVCDTSEMDLKQEGLNAVQAVKDNINNQINSAKNTTQNVKDNVNNIINTQKQNIQTQKENIEQTKQNIRNLKENTKQNTQNLKNLLLNSATNASKKINETKPQQSSETKTETTTQSDTQTSTQTSATTSSNDESKSSDSVSE